jgi:hypothetical protein
MTELFSGSNRRPGAERHWVYQGSQVDFSNDGHCNRCKAEGNVLEFSSPGSEYAQLEFCFSCIEWFLEKARTFSRPLPKLNPPLYPGGPPEG